MKDRIKKYVDNLFLDIYETRQLRELKEEVSANLLEKVNDFVASGNSDEDAFIKAVSSLGDMSELVECFKKTSEVKFEEDITKAQCLDRNHVLGYVVASAILLFGIMSAGIDYLKMKDLLATAGTLMPFIIISVPLFIYFGLTRETIHEYGMNGKRAIAYSLATALLLFGGFETAFIYFKGNELFKVLATSMPFIMPSVIVFIYLGLTEKSRSKINLQWQKQWIEYYYSDPKSMMLRGNISGALWMFAIAGFFLIGLTWGWKYSWIVFIIATGFEVLIEASFTTKRKK